MISTFVHRLAAYEYCPARYRLEKPSSMKAPSSRFEVFQILFRQYFRTMQYERSNFVKMEKLVDDYKGILFPEGQSISSRVIVAYAMKSFEKLYHDIKPQGYELPDTFKFNFNDVTLFMPVDLIYMENTDDTHRRRINFVMLIDNEYWDEVSLSNRLEVFFVKKVLFPHLREGPHTKFRITFMNPEKSKVFHIDGDEASIAGYKRRIEKILDNLKDKWYARRPIGAICAHCPQFSKCSPVNYQAEVSSLDQL